MPFLRNGATVVAACLALLSCGEPPEESKQANAVAQQPAEPARLPVAEPPLDREALLLAAIRAASAYAGGIDDATVQRGLDGQRFEMRFRFGCPGLEEGAETTSLTARFEADPRRLHLRAAPDVRLDDPSLAGIVEEQVEAIEGFWVARPWLLRSACPAFADEAVGGEPPGRAGSTGSPASLPLRQIAIVQLFTEADSRTRRRDRRPYELTKRLEESEAPSAQGYDLVIAGRLRRIADGRVIACSGSGAESAPVCLISVVTDRVWIERADTGASLVDWGSA